jgi:endo-1,4-beta-xylanase
MSRMLLSVRLLAYAAAPMMAAAAEIKPIVPGGQVVPLYARGSAMLNNARADEPEQYTMSQTVPGRIRSMVNVHNPSIEFHPVDAGSNTGATVILAAGGGHSTLVIGSESADLVGYFFNYGVNTVILRYRLRKDGYDARVDAVNDALQAIRMVRVRAKEWNLDPNRIGIMGFSAGAELVSAAAVEFDSFDKKYPAPDLPATSRPDFVGILYPGPSPFAKNRTPPPIPRNAPPAFIATPGSGDREHAIWAMEYFSAMLDMGVPNIEMHIYGNGIHGGGITDRKGIPLGTWQNRFIDWFRDLGFLQAPGIETKGAKDSAAFVSQPPRRAR